MHSKTSHTSTIFDLRSLFIITKPFLEPSYDLLSYSPFTDHRYFLYYNSEFQNILGKAADTRAWSLRADLWFFIIWFSKGKNDSHAQNIHTMHQNPIYKAQKTKTVLKLVIYRTFFRKWSKFVGKTSHVVAVFDTYFQLVVIYQFPSPRGYHDCVFYIPLKLLFYNSCISEHFFISKNIFQFLFAKNFRLKNLDEKNLFTYFDAKFPKDSKNRT